MRDSEDFKPDREAWLRAIFRKRTVCAAEKGRLMLLWP
jgi:hypothetical protein